MYSPEEQAYFAQIRAYLWTKPNTARRDLLDDLLRVEGYERGASLERMARCHDLLLMPLLIESVEHGDVILALKLEHLIGEHYTKTLETEAHFLRSYVPTVPYLSRLGTATDTGNVRLLKKDRYTLVFFVINTWLAAHTENMLALLRSLRADARYREFRLVVLTLVDNAQKNFKGPLSDIGVELIVLGQLLPTVRHGYQAVPHIGEQLKTIGCDAVIWVSNPLYMAYTFSQRVAPVQIWWSMKYKCIALDAIDEYMTMGTCERWRTYHGRSWRIVHGAIGDLCDSSKAEEAARIRLKSKGRLIFGCCGREEKIDNPAYLDAVCDILQAVPESVYLWSGRNKLASVVRHFEARGVAERCFFIGWVDTRLYAQVFDIYLDSFPFGGGHTVFQALAAGTPVVMLHSHENEQTGVLMHFMPFLERSVDETAQRDFDRIFNADAEALLPFADTVEGYVATALRLVGDPTYRARHAQAGRAFTEHFVQDESLTAASFAFHIRDIFQQRLALEPA